MEAPIGRTADRSAWRDVVPHRDDTFIQDFDVFERFLAVSVRSGGLSKISIHPLGAQALPEFFIASDEPAYTMGLSVNPRIDTHVLRYVYSSLTTPATVYDYDIITGERTLLKRDPVLGRFDPAEYATEFIFVAARDGARVPVSIVYRKEVARNGTAPLLQYAYGAYGLSMDPYFSASRLSLLDRGFVFAIAHVRGGQEMGRAWYDDGRLLNKTALLHRFHRRDPSLVARGFAHPAQGVRHGGQRRRNVDGGGRQHERR